MSGNLLSGSSTALRYESRRPQLMTFVVTRQAQNFRFGASQDFCDIQLMRASVQLMGDPPIEDKGGLFGANGLTYNGVDVTQYGYTHDSVNLISPVNHGGATSTVKNITGPNEIKLRDNSIMHDWVSVGIQGMMEPHHFLRDNTDNMNSITMITPTDMGVPAKRTGAMQSMNPPVKFEAVKLDQNLIVHTHFMGSLPQEKRLARFVEDYADTNPSTLRNPDGTVKYFADQAGVFGATQSVSQIPANMINCMILEFLVTPRVAL